MLTRDQELRSIESTLDDVTCLVIVGSIVDEYYIDLIKIEQQQNCEIEKLPIYLCGRDVNIILVLESQNR